MVDLFQRAGITVAGSLRGKSKKAQPQSKRHGASDGDDESYGGHNLRLTIPTKTRDASGSVTQRPRSALAKGKPPPNLADIEDDGDDYENEDDMEESEAEDDDDDDGGDDDDANEENTPTPTTAPATSGPTPTTTATTTAHTPQPFPQTKVTADSALGREAATLFSAPGFKLSTELAWQSTIASDSTKQRAFRNEVTQIMDLVGFGFMRPSSPYVQILHSVATFAVRGGGSEFHNKDFGYIGDRTTLRTPTPVQLDDKLWKWVAKKISPDIGPLELFYANQANSKALFSMADAGVTSTAPRMAYLPPPFLAFCVESQRTPFQLHQFISAYAIRDGSETTVAECQTLLDWCLMAAHTTAPPATSVIAVTLETAPSDDDNFIRWLQKIDVTTTHLSTMPATPKPTAGGNTAVAPTAPPSQDVWKSMAETISKSFVSAASAMKTTTDDEGASYEDGGLKYDEFQMAVIQGFAHVDDITGVPILWAMFQYTKNLETH